MSSKPDIPWGFIQSSDPDLQDTHFTLFALDNIPEHAISKGLIVQYSVIPGTNTAEHVSV